MAVVGFAVLFAGIVSPQAATASTAALLTFVLPVAVAQPASAVGPRLVGWALAGAFSIPACMLVWPTPWHDDLRRRLVGDRGRLWPAGGGSRRGQARSRGAQATVNAELSLLRDQFAATPYPPTGAAAGAVAWPSWWVGSSGWPAMPRLSSGRRRDLELPPGPGGDRDGGRDPAPERRR